MLLAFIDETGDKKRKDYLGLSIAVLNGLHYPQIKRKAQNVLTAGGWAPDVEFKGAHLFSSTKGCPDVSIEQRIQIAHGLLDLNIAKQNARMRFHFGAMASTDPSADYLKYLPGLLHQAIGKAPKGAGKNLLAVTCDQRDDLDHDSLDLAIDEVAGSRGYVVMERVHMARSSFHTIGLMYADIVGYLMGRIDTISTDAELFDGLTEAELASSNAARRLRTSLDLAGKIRRLTTYSHALSPVAAA